MAFNKTDRPDGAKMRRPGGMRRRKKVCVFCGDKNGTIDYKDVNKLKRYVSERGKILPRRITHAVHCTESRENGVISLLCHIPAINSLFSRD